MRKKLSAVLLAALLVFPSLALPAAEQPAFSFLEVLEEALTNLYQQMQAEEGDIVSDRQILGLSSNLNLSLGGPAKTVLGMFLPIDLGPVSSIGLDIKVAIEDPLIRGEHLFLVNEKEVLQVLDTIDLDDHSLSVAAPLLSDAVATGSLD
ncbi:MAG: hypothetical protein IIZ39_12310, partial [Blautia sp.]|nr:hypothetical protein [Blautia sp.]